MRSSFARVLFASRHISVSISGRAASIRAIVRRRSEVWYIQIKFSSSTLKFIRVGFLDTVIRFGEFDFEALEIPFFHQIIAETAYSPHIGLNRDVVTAPVLKIEDKAL